MAERVVPILVFVAAMTVVAELSDRLGVFTRIADAAARVARGSVLRLWLLICAAAVLITAVLSLDTTAVLVTPVALTLARQLGVDLRLFAFTTVWLANTASLFLPASNLTNLLARQRLDLTAREFAAATWPVATAAVGATVLLLALRFGSALRQRYGRTPVDHPPDRALLVVAFAVCAAIGPATLLGVRVEIAAVLGAIVIVVGTAVRQPELLRSALRSGQLVPWRLLIGVTVLFVLVQLAQQAGLAVLLGAVAGTGTGWLDLLRVAAAGTVAANLINNLPAYLALEPVAGTLPRAVALLIGVNVGPLITPWASLATLLWIGRCRSAGVAVSPRSFVLAGLILVPVQLLLTVTVLAVTGS